MMSNLYEQAPNWDEPGFIREQTLADCQWLFMQWKTTDVLADYPDVFLPGDPIEVDDEA